jgi:hypothetical protein
MTPPDRFNAEPRLRIVAAALVLAFSLHAQSARADTGLDDASPFGSDAAIEAVDDDLLDGLRGRWSGPNGVVGIGIDLRSIWDTGNGSTLSAGISLQADREAIARQAPIVTSSASVTNGTTVRGAGGGDRSVLGDDPTVRVAGLGQLVQLAGDRNRASNELDVGFMPQGRGATLPTATGPADASSFATGADGASASASTAGGAFVIDLVVPGTGRVSQRLGAVDEAPGIKQSIRIAGDDQAIRNIATLRLTIAPLGQRAMIDGAVLRALSSMSGLRR